MRFCARLAPVAVRRIFLAKNPAQIAYLRRGEVQSGVPYEP